MRYFHNKPHADIQDFDRAFVNAEQAGNFELCEQIEQEAEKVLPPEDFYTFINAGNPAFRDKNNSLLPLTDEER